MAKLTRNRLPLYAYVAAAAGAGVYILAGCAVAAVKGWNLFRAWTVL